MPFEFCRERYVLTVKTLMDRKKVTIDVKGEGRGGLFRLVLSYLRHTNRAALSH